MALKFLNDGYFAGKVGIGETNPTEKLEINGQFGKTTLNGHVIAYTRASANYLWAKSVGGDLRFTVDGNAIGSPSLVLSTAGNLGIGNNIIATNALSVEKSIANDYVVEMKQLYTTTNNSYGLNIQAGTSASDIAFRITTHTVGEVFRVRGDGFVGIGVLTPVEKLTVFGQVASTSSSSTVSTAGANRAIMDLTGGGARMGHFRGATAAGSGFLRLFTDSVERMRITSAGNVGIGTTSPTEPLTISKTASGSTTQIASLVNPVGTANTGVRLWMSGTNTTTRGTFIDAVAETTSNDHSLRFGTSASSSTPTERMRITSGGNVGIGTTSPTYKLQVAGKSYLSGGVQLNSGDRIDFGNSQQYITGVNSTSLTLVTGNSATLTALDNGNVGIGTTSPGEKLDLAGTNVGVKINGTQSSRVYYNRSGTYTWSTGLRSGDTKFHIFDERSGDRVVIDDTGNVGIGTTSPGSKLTVNGSFSADTGSFSNELTLSSNLRLQNNITILNKAQSAYISFATRNTTGSEVVMDLTNVGSINGGAAGPYLPLAGGTMTGNTKHNDDVFSYWGNSDDLSIQHNNSGQFAQMKNYTGDLYFTNTADDKDIIFQADNSTNGTETYLTVDGSNRSILVTAPLGVYHNDGIAARFGNAGDCLLYTSPSPRDS